MFDIQLHRLGEPTEIEGKQPAEGFAVLDRNHRIGIGKESRVIVGRDDAAMVIDVGRVEVTEDFFGHVLEGIAVSRASDLQLFQGETSTWKGSG